MQRRFFVAYASMQNEQKCLELLPACNPGDIDANGNDLLMIACMQTTSTIALAILEDPRFASYTTINNKSETALMLACRSGMNTVAKTIVSKCNDPKYLYHYNESGEDAIFLACQNGLDVVSMLITKDYMGVIVHTTTAFLYAIQLGDINTVKLLLNSKNCMLCPQKVMQSALLSGCTPIIILIIDNGGIHHIQTKELLQHILNREDLLEVSSHLIKYYPEKVKQLLLPNYFSNNKVRLGVNTLQVPQLSH